MTATKTESPITHESLDQLDFVRTGPETLAGCYLRTYWHPIYVADELPVGWAKPIRVMNEDFTLYRGANGQTHLVGFRCAHRGTQLSAGWVEDDCIRCLYHGWKYDASGQCVEQPGEASSFASMVRIPSYPTLEYLGLVFAYLGEGDPPPLPRYPDFEGEGVRLVRGRIRRCNYFSDVENSTDLFHVAWAHRQARDVGSMHSLDYVPSSLSVEESDWGIIATVNLANGSTRTNQFGMPTMLHFRAGNEAIEEGGTEPTNVILWRVPITDEVHANFSVRLIQITGAVAERFRENRGQRAARSYIAANDLADIILRGEFRTQDIGQRDDVRRWEIVNVQDDVTQVGQGIIPDREHERRGATDIGVVLLREIWKRELRAFADGQPLKQWSRPVGMVATSGR